MTSNLELQTRPVGCPPVTVLICALNEEPNLPYVLPKIPGWVDEIILVDGHSADKTVEVARQLRPEIKILNQPGKGKGDALKFGVQQAVGEIIVTLDADGETPPEEMNNFICPLLQGNEFAKGSRLFKKRPAKMPSYRWFGNKVLAITCNLLFRTHFTDICSGYNAFWKSKFLQLDLTYAINEVGCSMEQQMIVRARKAGMKVKEVPHTSNGRISGKSVLCNVKQSVIQGIRDWFIIIGERFRG
jgi:glycosyltransferase involved in cell wall biosynthesis